MFALVSRTGRGAAGETCDSEGRHLSEGYFFKHERVYQGFMSNYGLSRGVL